jgi:hypothetical protein
MPPFLAEGAALGERLMYVAADPGPVALAWLAEVVSPHALQVASIAEVYGPSGVVDARLRDAGVPVIIRGDQAALGELTARGLVAGDRAILQVDGSHRE